MRHPRLPGISARLLAVASVVLFAVIGAVALLLARGATDYAGQAADQRARLGVDLLVGVGTAFPSLTPASLSRGFSPADAAELDAAVARGRRAGLVSEIQLWDRSGLLAYSSAERLEGSKRRVEPDLQAALAGAHVALRHPTEPDRSRPGAHGVLDAFEPLRDGRGRVFGALEMSLPLTPITAQASALRDRIYLFALVGAVSLWLVLLPLGRRLARTISAAWVPNRRRTLRVVARALAHDRIELLYQPQVCTHDGTCVGVEALVRLQVDGALHAPDSFLPHVEGSPLDDALADRVVDIAFAQLAAWRAAGHDIRMSVNLSAHNLTRRDLPDRIRAALDRHECDAAHVTFEVTETGVLHELGASHEVVRELAALGADLALDDFGTGHSSISRLRGLPIRELKVDRSFVMPSDARSRAFVAAMVGFARGLGLRVVAEGVEDEDALDYLDGLGCDVVQGYHVCRPRPAHEISDWLAENAARPALLQAA